MSTKFNRIYRMIVVGNNGQEYTIEYPLTCEFTIQRQNLASVNTANFTIYNLEESTRNAIYKDIFDINLNRSVKFFAGYRFSDSDNFMTECFHGEIKQAFSVREGPNWKTTIECWDGGRALALGFANVTVTSGKTKAEVIQEMSKGEAALPGIKNILVGEQFQTDKSERATTVCGPTTQALSAITNNGFYIDSQDAYCIGKNEAIQFASGYIDRIDNSMGILETPRKNQTFIEVTTLFEPRISPSQSVQLLTDLFKGTFKIVGFTHTGTISGTVSGEYKTTMSLLNANNFNLVPSANLSKVVVGGQ